MADDAFEKKNAFNCYHLADLGFEFIHIHGANVQQRLDRDVWLTIYGQVWESFYCKLREFIIQSIVIAHLTSPN